MSETERPYEAYVYALREQVAQYLSGLDELAATLAQRAPCQAMCCSVFARSRPAVGRGSGLPSR